MTDAHCHVSCGDPSVRELLVGRDFFGVHPWDAVDGTSGTTGTSETRRALVPDIPVVPDVSSLASLLASLRSELLDHPNAGVGEIGLDRLKSRDISPRMREVFEAQLALALELHRPVVLHGAKCWGQVVTAVERMVGDGLGTGDVRQAFLFHGFSRSDGLIPEIVKLNGFISVGPAVLNDHAVNYRELVKKIPLDRLLVETDRTASSDSPSISDVLAKTAGILNLSTAELERITDENADRFFGVV